MSEDWRKTIGNACIGFGLAGIIVQVYLNHKLKQTIEFLRQNIIINPSQAEYNELTKDKNQFELSWCSFFFGTNFIVYLNGPLMPITQQIVKDSDFGYAIHCISLIRKVEKLQWDYDESGKAISKWSESSINPFTSPNSHKFTPWLLNSDIFRAVKTCSLNTFQLRTKSLAPYLSYSPCSYPEDIKSQNFFDLNPQKTNNLQSKKNSENFLLSRKTISPRMQQIIRNELENFQMSDKYLTLNTKNNGSYQISYLMAASNQRVTLIGKVVKNQIIPVNKVFLEHGDVGLDLMLEKIDSKFNWNLAFTLISVVWFGFSIS